MPFLAPYLRSGNQLPPGVRVPFALGDATTLLEGQKSGEQLVRMARQFSGIMDRGTFRDGFPDDAESSDGLISILDFVNEAKRELLPTGYAKCRFTLPVTAGKYEYTLDPFIHEVLSATFQGKPLKPVTPGWLDENRQRWRFQGLDPAAVYGTLSVQESSLSGPRHYYTYSDQIGLYPAPLDSDTLTQESLEVLADTWVPDLVTRSDTPGRLPARTQQGLALFAAILMCNADAENEASQLRLAFLSKLWEKEYSDLQQIVQSRDQNREARISVADYRTRWRRR